MQMVSLVAAPATFFLPSRSVQVSVGKLALFGVIFTTFFLFTAGYNFPGGAQDYPNWAEAIVRGTTLPPVVAQREVGFSLLYILGGFPWSHSFVGITLIQAVFAVLIPMLVYWAIARASPRIAFYSGLACIISLSPYTYMKFFYPDQADIFFNLLAVALLIEFLWTGRFRMLYFFTLAALAASFTRTAGNLMFPVLLTIAFITVRGRFRHYLACTLIFVLAMGAYQLHRYEIFDMRNQKSTPSGTGMQILYSTYLYLGDFGYRLSPDIGPNTKRMLEKIREELRPTVRESVLIRRNVGDTPPEFMEKYFYAFTPEQLIEKLSTEPNEEYYWNVLFSIDDNDQFRLAIAKEIALSHPWYIVQYSARNLWHAVFDPGYATTRYNTQGYIKTGNDFVPGTQSWGVHSADPVAQYGTRAEREMEYFPLKTKSQIVQRLFHQIETVWILQFSKYVWITSILVIIAWVGTILGMLCWIVPRARLCGVVKSTGANKLLPPIIVASALLLYQDLATAMFSQPVYRYFHMTEPLRLVIAGFGAIFIMVALSYVWQARIAAVATSFAQPRRWDIVSTIQKYDILEQYFGQRRTQMIYGLIAVTTILFIWWAFRLMAHA